MNFLADHNIVDAVLLRLLLKASSDLGAWSAVLQHVVEMTDAKAASVTLRDAQTCQIIHDSSLETQYHSPLVYGFALEDMQFYLENLRETDPWADAQRVHYPTFPSLMSDKVPSSLTQDGAFYQWIARSGISETIVFELCHMSGYWTAFNLFLPHKGREANQEALHYLNTHMEVLKEAWQTIQKLNATRQITKSALEFYARLDIPACVMSSETQVVGQNSAFERLVERDAIRLVGSKKRLVCTEDERFFRKLLACKTAKNWACSEGQQYNVTLNDISSDPLYDDRGPKLFVVVFLPRSSTVDSLSAPALLRDLEILNPQEERLYGLIRDGLTVTSAGQNMGIKRTRTFEIWASIKRKLGIRNAHDLR